MKKNRNAVPVRSGPIRTLDIPAAEEHHRLSNEWDLGELVSSQFMAQWSQERFSAERPLCISISATAHRHCHRIQWSLWRVAASSH